MVRQLRQLIALTEDWSSLPAPESGVTLFPLQASDLSRHNLPTHLYKQVEKAFILSQNTRLQFIIEGK